nr:putative zinc-binding metallopeptidase [Nocardioides convexus]
MFGDETTDYQAEIDRHYAEGPPEGWEASFITTYATMHPFEDFAETFAHYLHISDTCETAAAYGLATVDVRAFSVFRDLVRAVWVPLSVALNQINRSMGKEDVYPFVIPAPVLDKARLRREPGRRGMMPPRRRTTLVVVAVVVLAVAAGVTGLVLALRGPGPDDVAEDYLRAQWDGDARTECEPGLGAVAALPLRGPGVRGLRGLRGRGEADRERDRVREVRRRHRHRGHREDRRGRRRQGAGDLRGGPAVPRCGPGRLRRAVAGRRAGGPRHGAARRG